MEGKTNGMSITVKKWLSILFILSVLTGCMVVNAIADDFSVRNGIQFGMSVDDVKAKEKENGLSEDNIYYEKEDGNFYKIWYSTTIAGIEDSRLLFRFSNESKKLIEINYCLGKSDINEEAALSIFSIMSESLLAKYGQPLHSYDTDGISFPIQTEYMKSIELVDSNYRYNQWLIEYEEYYILIENSCCNYKYYPFVGSDYYLKQPCSTVSYKYITKEEAINAFQEMDKQETQLKEQINRDI